MLSHDPLRSRLEKNSSLLKTIAKPWTLKPGGYSTNLRPHRLRLGLLSRHLPVVPVPLRLPSLPRVRLHLYLQTKCPEDSLCLIASNPVLSGSFIKAELLCHSTISLKHSRVNSQRLNAIAQKTPWPEETSRSSFEVSRAFRRSCMG